MINNKYREESRDCPVPRSRRENCRRRVSMTNMYSSISWTLQSFSWLTRFFSENWEPFKPLPDYRHDDYLSLQTVGELFVRNGLWVFESSGRSRKQLEPVWKSSMSILCRNNHTRILIEGWGWGDELLTCIEPHASWGLQAVIFIRWSA